MRRLVGAIFEELIVRDSTASDEAEGLLLETTARLEVEPPRVPYEDECKRSGSAIPARACTITYTTKLNKLLNVKSTRSKEFLLLCYQVQKIASIHISRNSFTKN